MDITENLEELKEEIGNEVVLVAVSKTKPNEDILAAYQAGQRVFGENKAQEMTQKQAELPEDIEWHMIGHLQTNKVKYIAPYVSLIHSIHKMKLLKEVNKRARQNDRVIDVLLQMHIAEEDSKFGMDKNELEQLLNSEVYAQMENIRVVGLMGMATFTDDESKVRKEFQHLKSVYDSVKYNYFKEAKHFNVLSMGMSGDYPIAIEEGSNMVRIGSKIFGARN